MAVTLAGVRSLTVLVAPARHGRASAGHFADARVVVAAAVRLAIAVGVDAVRAEGVAVVVVTARRFTVLAVEVAGAGISGIACARFADVVVVVTAAIAVQVAAFGAAAVAEAVVRAGRSTIAVIVAGTRGRARATIVAERDGVVAVAGRNAVRVRAPTIGVARAVTTAEWRGVGAGVPADIGAGVATHVHGNARIGSTVFGAFARAGLFTDLNHTRRAFFTVGCRLTFIQRAADCPRRGSNQGEKQSMTQITRHKHLQSQTPTVGPLRGISEAHPARPLPPTCNHRKSRMRNLALTRSGPAKSGRMVVATSLSFDNPVA